jgi:hypothetical protein
MAWIVQTQLLAHISKVTKICQTTYKESLTMYKTNHYIQKNTKHAWEKSQSMYLPTA